MSNDLEILRLSAPTVQGNLDIDAELARTAVRDGRRVLRFWWGGPPTVVLGCADKPEIAADLDECGRHGIQVIKRITGGGTVLQTEGVFNYSYTAPDTGSLDIHRMFGQGAILVIDALASLGISARHKGVSDIAIGERKISGNAQARKWHAILLHGTVLVDIDHDLLETVLRHPTREPDYRQGRKHSDFIVTLRDLGVKADRDDVENAFARAAVGCFDA